MNNKLFIFWVILIFGLTSCHWHSNVAVIHNKKQDTIAAIPWNDKELGPITDSMVYNNRLYMPDRINPGESKSIALPDRHFENASDTDEIDLYIFSLDSINTFRKKKNSSILKSSLLRKIRLPVKQLAKKIDTFELR